jgi:hypothetical protein
MKMILYLKENIQNAGDGLRNDCFNWLERVANNNKDNATVVTNYN